MLISTKAIVLSKLRYKDSDLIIKCYTEKEGVKSYLLKNSLKTKRGKFKPAYFQLLTLLEIEAEHKDNRSLQGLKDVKLGYHYTSLHTNVIKSAIVMFLAEVLSSVLKEEESNPILFKYIETTLQWLDTNNQNANFHLLFLLNLSKPLGFYPETSNSDLGFFNLSEGKFESNPSNSYSISGKNLELLKRLLGMVFADLSEIKVSSKQRQSFLTMILLYYELHLSTFKKPKSLQILNQLFI